MRRGSLIENLCKIGERLADDCRLFLGKRIPTQRTNP